MNCAQGGGLRRRPVPRTGPAWQIAFHRFAEVSIGIGVALMLAMVWPEREATAPEKK